MIAPLSRRTVDLLKASAPALETYALPIAHAACARLFRDPEIAALFALDRPGPDGAQPRAQPRALSQALQVLARNIDRPEALAGLVGRVARAQAELSLEAEHYAKVGAALRGAFCDILCEAATPEVLEAFDEAYRFLAGQLMLHEARLRLGGAA